jgi:hypothetical protein
MGFVAADTEKVKAGAHVIAATKLGGHPRLDMYETVTGESVEIAHEAFVAMSGARADADVYLGALALRRMRGCREVARS